MRRTADDNRGCVRSARPVKIPASARHTRHTHHRRRARAPLPTSLGRLVEPATKKGPSPTGLGSFFLSLPGPHRFWIPGLCRQHSLPNMGESQGLLFTGCPGAASPPGGLPPRWPWRGRAGRGPTPWIWAAARRITLSSSTNRPSPRCSSLSRPPVPLKDDIPLHHALARPNRPLARWPRCRIGGGLPGSHCHAGRLPAGLLPQLVQSCGRMRSRGKDAPRGREQLLLARGVENDTARLLND